ncbi:class I adenylate-forming enzyme family protein [Mycolicibacterium sp. XJ1819]
MTHAAERWPHREALVLGENRLTYLDLYQRSETVAHGLIGCGLKPGDRLLWQLPNRLESVILHFAAWRIGLVSMPVVPVYREHELRSILADSQPQAVAFCGTSDEVLGKVALAGQEATRAGHPAPLVIDLDGHGLPTGTGARLPDPPGPDEPDLILFTSGTTSAPKGAVHCGRTVMAEANSWLTTIGLDSDMVALMGAPISHIAGLLTAVIVPVLAGGRAVIMPRWDPDTAVKLIDREAVTISAGASVFLRDLVERYENPAFTGLRLSVFLGGGSNVDPDLVYRADALGIRAFRSWGMTEAPSLTLASPSEPLERRANFDGRVVAGAQVQAVDDHRRPLPPGEQGELRLRCLEQMLGYLKPEHTAASVDAEGWYYSGDIGSVTEDGWVRVTGRKKDIINRGGEKFSARDIEEVIVRHPAISMAAVIATPDPRLGEQVTGIVTLRDGWQWPGRAHLAAHLDGSGLARQKFPQAWRVVDEIPMTPSGKAQKHLLLQMWHDVLADSPELE